MILKDRYSLTVSAVLQQPSGPPGVGEDSSRTHGCDQQSAMNNRSTTTVVKCDPRSTRSLKFTFRV